MFVHLFEQTRELKVTDNLQYMDLVMQRLGKENLLEDYHSERWRAGKQLIALYVFRSSWVNKTST